MYINMGVIIKSFSVKSQGDIKGDMFYILHSSDNFTMIDCCLSDDDKEDIVNELKALAKQKGMQRFISTHPDEDHIKQLDYLDDELKIWNFYCVKNKAIKKTEESNGFKRYCQLRDSDIAFYIEKGCSRKWMNKGDEKRGSAGINIYWPNTNNDFFKEELSKVNEGESPNNISPIIYYSLKGGVVATWMGDLETDFMEKIENDLNLPKTNILFAPHHGRESGTVPKSLLDKMKPDIIIIGEAPSQNLNYYQGYNTITQNSAKHITFDCVFKKVHIYSSNENYSVDFLTNEHLDSSDDTFYIGTLQL